MLPDGREAEALAIDRYNTRLVDRRDGWLLLEALAARRGSGFIIVPVNTSTVKRATPQQIALKK
jgi:hypothetical protein